MKIYWNLLFLLSCASFGAAAEDYGRLVYEVSEEEPKENRGFREIWQSGRPDTGIEETNKRSTQEKMNGMELVQRMSFADPEKKYRRWLDCLDQYRKALDLDENELMIRKRSNATDNSTLPEIIGHLRFPRFMATNKSKPSFDSFLRSTIQGKRKSKYDPALKFMGLGKRDPNYNPALRFKGLVKRDSNYDPALKFMGLGKRDSNYDPAMRFMGQGKRDSNYDPAMRFMGLGKRDSNYDPALRFMGLGKRDSNYDPALRFMGIGKREPNYDPALRFMGLGKREPNYDPAMRFMGLGKRDSNYDPALRFMGLGKRDSNYDPALRFMGLGKRGSNYDPALRFMGLGKRGAESKQEFNGDVTKRSLRYDPAMKFIALGKRGRFDPGLKVMGLGKKGGQMDSDSKVSNGNGEAFGSVLNVLSMGKRFPNFNYGKRLKTQGKGESLYDPALKYMGLGKRDVGNPTVKIVGTGNKNSAVFRRMKRSAGDFEPVIKYYSNNTVREDDIVYGKTIDNREIQDKRRIIPMNLTNNGNLYNLDIDPDAKYRLLKQLAMKTSNGDNENEMLKMAYRMCDADYPSNVTVVFEPLKNEHYSPMDILTKYAHQKPPKSAFGNLIYRQKRMTDGFPKFDAGWKIMGLGKWLPKILCGMLIASGDHSSFNENIYGAEKGKANDNYTTNEKDRTYLKVSTTIKASIFKGPKPPNEALNLDDASTPNEESRQSFQALAMTPHLLENKRGEANWKIVFNPFYEKSWGITDVGS